MYYLKKVYKFENSFKTTSEEDKAYTRDILLLFLNVICKRNTKHVLSKCKTEYLTKLKYIL